MSTTTSAKSSRSLPLSRSADPKLRDALAAGRHGIFRRTWLKNILKPRKRMLRRLPPKSWLALWSANSTELSERERTLAAALEVNSPKPRATKKSRRTPTPLEHALAAWHAAVNNRPAPWESLAVAEVLLRTAEQLQADTFINCLAVLARINSRPVTIDADDATDTVTLPDPLECELAWVLGILLAPVSGSAKLQRSGSTALQQLLRSCTDQHGLPLGSAVPQLPAILCTLARCTAWSRIFQQPLWNDYESHLQRLVEATSLLLVPPQPADPSAPADNSCPPTPDSCLLPALQQLLADDSGEHPARYHKLLRKVHRPVTAVRPPKRYKPAKDAADSKSASDTSPADTDSIESSEAGTEAISDTTAAAAPITNASWQSDKGRVAVLRSSTRADADLVIVDWHSETVHLQVYAAGVLIFSGPWHWSARINEESAAGPAAWKCSCWFDDPECVFLELEADCGNGLQGVRQLMLATHERCLMLTDSVTAGNSEPRLQLTTALPFSEGTSIEPDPITRELRMTRGPVAVRLVPVWLDDDRIRHTFGQCQAHDGQLECTSPGAGGVTLPLMLDWHPHRISEPADWSALTVTEARRYTGMHEAAGFRVRSGSFQLLIYRSLLQGRDSRAVMGLHTWDESVYTRVPGRETPMEPLVSVETPE